MQHYSSSDRSVGYLLLSMGRSVGHHHARRALSRQSLEEVFSETRRGYEARERTGTALRPSPSRLFYPLVDSPYLRPVIRVQQAAAAEPADSTSSGPDTASGSL